MVMRTEPQIHMGSTKREMIPNETTPVLSVKTLLFLNCQHQSAE